MIKLLQVEKTYEGAAGPVKALKGINLEIKRGEIYGIIGLSGAGKSTLIRCINMLERPTAGKVMVDGQELTAMDDKQLRAVRKEIGMIFQHFNLLSSATVYENIAFPLRLAGADEKKISEKVTPLLELVGLKDKAGQYPAQLSGGQKQRLTIARALVKKPEILILDDSASALDYATDANLRHAIRNMKTRPAVFLVSQRAASILHADQILVLDDGNVAGLGTHETLLKSCEVYQEIYYSQFRRETTNKEAKA